MAKADRVLSLLKTAGSEAAKERSQHIQDAMNILTMSVDSF